MEEHVILRALVGSHSVGTATPDSDKDYMEVVLGGEDVYLGLDWWGEQGTKEEKRIIDGGTIQETTSYELRKFLRLCHNFNPNVAPFLWLPNDAYEIKTSLGQRLLNYRFLFVSKIAITSFIGFAERQLKKIAQTDAPTGRMGAKRKELREKYGYDAKYAYHTVRLVRMLIEFLESNGTVLNVNRTNIDVENLIAIRNGEFSLLGIQEEVSELFNKARLLEKSCSLPDKPNKEGIRALCSWILRDHLNLI